MNSVLERESSSQVRYEKTVKPINFYYLAPEAESVYLIGDFNRWNPRAHPMEKRPDGWWYVQVPLSHGYHEYLYLVDGTPTLDPHATGVTANARYAKVSITGVS